VVGIVVSLTFLAWFKQEIDAANLAREQAPVTERVPVPVAPARPPATSPAPRTPAAPATSRKATKVRRDPRQDLKRLAERTPWWVIPLIELFEFGSIMFFFLLLPVTFAVMRLEFEMHWYIVTDRSLRIRTGLYHLQEATMSFANLQQVEVKQGPLQRLLGLADVHVQSAGGGSVRPQGQIGDSLHTGIFHSVDNANEIRDLILQRLRQFRQAGLGDPDDHAHHVAAPAPADATSADAVTAARELLAEAKALRATLA